MAGQMVETPPRQERLTMTYDEWLAWDGEGHRGEWVDGEVVVFMPPEKPHQRIVWFLGILLGWYALVRELGEVVIAPFEMRLRPGRSSRQPDLLFVERDHLNRLGRKRLDGPADLVIEVISDDSVARDRADKFYEYQEAGVREYWIFDPRPGKERADFHRLNAAGKYEPGVLDADGRYHAAVLPGFWLRPDWLWQDPLPDPLTTLAVIAPDSVRAALSAALAGDQTASGDA